MAGKQTQKTKRKPTKRKPAKRKPAKRKKRKPSGGSVLPKLIGAALVVGALLVLGAYAYFSRDLPSVSALRDYKPPQTTRVYDRHKKVIGEIFAERRTVIPMSKVPRHMVLSVLAAEDADFYEHEGLDYNGILRAVGRDIVAGRAAQGGSTITQQVVKLMLLTPERTLGTKGAGAHLGAAPGERALQGRDPAPLSQPCELWPWALRRPGSGEVLLRQERERAHPGGVRDAGRNSAGAVATFAAAQSGSRQAAPGVRAVAAGGEARGLLA